MSNRIQKSWLALALVAALCVPQVALAADASWSVDAAGTWATGTNWNTSAAPGATTGTANTDVATFSTTLTAARTVTVDANRNIGGISFSSGGAASALGYTLSGGSLLLSNGAVIQTLSGTGSHNDTVASNITIQGDGGSATFRNDSTGNTAGLIISGTIKGVSTGSNVTTLTLDGVSTASGIGGTARNNNVNNVISDGTGGGKTAVVKNGTGLWTVVGNNSFTGGFTLNNGTIRTNGQANIFGLGTLYINGGGITMANSTAITFANATVIGGDFFLGGSTVNAGSVLAGTMDLGAVSRTITTNSNWSISGVISNGGLIKAGARDLNLTGANSYTGGTTVNAGMLNVTGSGTLGSSSALTTSGTSTILDLGGTNQTVGAVTVIGGTIQNGTLTGSSYETQGGTVSAVLAGAGSLTKTTSLTTTLTGNNNYSGSTAINDGKISLASINANLGGTGTIKLGSTTTGGTLTTTGASSETITRAIDLAGTTGGGTIENNNTAGNLTFSGTIGSTGAGSKTLTLKGTAGGDNKLTNVISDNSAANTTSVLIADGSWILSGTNTFTGGVTVNSGAAVKTGSAQALGGTGSVLTLAGGSWSPSGADVTLANNVNISADSKGNALGVVTEFTGAISGTGEWAVNGFADGTMKFSGNNSDWSGSFKINGGNKVQLNHVNALGTGTNFTFSDGVSANGTGVLESLVDLSGTGISQNIVLGTTGAGVLPPQIMTTAAMKLTGVISGPTGIGFVKSGASKLILTNTNLYTGATTVSAGTLEIGTTGSISTSPVIKVANLATYQVDVGAEALSTRDVRSQMTGGTSLQGQTDGLKAWIYQDANATAQSVTMAWRERSGAPELALLASNVLTYTQPTTPSYYVLAMQYDDTMVLGGETMANIAWNNGGIWTLLGANLETVQANMDMLGDYLIDQTNNTVYVVTNHNASAGTEFAVIPEPGTLVLLATGLLGLLAYAWRKRRS